MELTPCKLPASPVNRVDSAPTELSSSSNHAHSCLNIEANAIELLQNTRRIELKYIVQVDKFQHEIQNFGICLPCSGGQTNACLHEEKRLQYRRHKQNNSNDEE